MRQKVEHRLHLDDFVQQFTDQGLLLNNLYCDDSGTFRANFRYSDSFGFSYGYGASPEAALRDAAKHVPARRNLRAVHTNPLRKTPIARRRLAGS